MEVRLMKWNEVKVKSALWTHSMDSMFLLPISTIATVTSTLQAQAWIRIVESAMRTPLQSVLEPWDTLGASDMCDGPPGWLQGELSQVLIEWGMEPTKLLTATWTYRKKVVGVKDRWPHHRHPIRITSPWEDPIDCVVHMLNDSKSE